MADNKLLETLKKVKDLKEAIRLFKDHANKAPAEPVNNYKLKHLGIQDVQDGLIKHVIGTGDQKHNNYHLDVDYAKMIDKKPHISISVVNPDGDIKDQSPELYKDLNGALKYIVTHFHSSHANDMKKSEDIKGVHQDLNVKPHSPLKNALKQMKMKPVESLKPIIDLKGQSMAGAHARQSAEAKNPFTKDVRAGHAKLAHQKVLSEQQSMPKPNLPKSEEMNKGAPKMQIPSNPKDKVLNYDKQGPVAMSDNQSKKMSDKIVKFLKQKQPMDKADNMKKASPGSKIGATQSGKDIMSHARVGETQFSPEEHLDASKAHMHAAQTSRDPKMQSHHQGKATLHRQAFKSGEKKANRFADKPTTSTTVTPTQAPAKQQGYGKLFDKDISGKMQPPGPNMKKSSLSKAKIDAGKPERQKYIDRFERNKPLKSGKLEERLIAGVHKPAYSSEPGTSNMGAHSNDSSRKAHSKQVLNEAKSMKKPNLPKSEEMNKATMTLQESDKPIKGNIMKKIRNILDMPQNTNDMKMHGKSQPVEKVDPQTHLPGYLLNKEDDLEGKVKMKKASPGTSPAKIPAPVKMGSMSMRGGMMGMGGGMGLARSEESMSKKLRSSLDKSMNANQKEAAAPMKENAEQQVKVAQVEEKHAMPKDDMVKSAPKMKNSHEKNAPLYQDDKGTSLAGDHVRFANRSKSWSKDPRSSSPSIERSMAATQMKSAKEAAAESMINQVSSKKPNLPKSEEMNKSGEAFAKLKNKLAHKPGVTDPAALAAAIGRKKMGKEAFQAKAAAGHKKSLAKDGATAANPTSRLDAGFGSVIMRSEENPDQKQDAKLGEAVEHIVENHMLENKAAERKEGHKIVEKAMSPHAERFVKSIKAAKTKKKEIM